MAKPTPKVVKYRYQNTTIEDVDDMDGTHIVPEKDAVITLHNKRYKVIWISVRTGAKRELPFYDVVVEEIVSDLDVK